MLIKESHINFVSLTYIHISYGVNTVYICGMVRAKLCKYRSTTLQTFVSKYMVDAYVYVCVSVCVYVCVTDGFNMFKLHLNALTVYNINIELLPSTIHHNAS